MEYCWGGICPSVKKKFSVQNKTVQLWLLQNLQNDAEVYTRVRDFVFHHDSHCNQLINFLNKFCYTEY